MPGSFSETDMRADSSSVPPRLRPPLSPAWFAAGVLGTVAVGATAVLYFFNPSTHAFYPTCAFHQLTGWNCPGCGATRALYALLHGNVQLAWKDNALLLLALAGLFVWGGRLAFQKLRHQPVRWEIPPRILFGFLTLAIAFGILRNLPGFTWLSP